MGGDSFASANSSSSSRIYRDTQNKIFNNCNINHGITEKFSLIILLFGYSDILLVVLRLEVIWNTKRSCWWPSIIFFVCLFVWSLSSHSRIFHSYGDVNITGEGLQISACALHSWPLSSEGSIACHNDTGHPFIMVLFCGEFSNGTVTTCFYDLVLWRLGFEHPTFRLPGKRSKPTVPPPR